MNNKNFKLKLFLCVIGIMFLYFAMVDNIGIPCVFHEITGLYCPGCGATRAIVSLCKFNFYQAIRYNVLIVSLIPVFMISFIFKKYKKFGNLFWGIVLCVAVIFGIIRNFSIFSFLAPMS